jgi:muramoyltetrapeptide carboxypeptidase
MVIKPKALREGDTIGIIAPAGPISRERLEQGEKVLHEMGFKIKYESSIFESSRYLAGSDQRRGEEFNRMFADPDVHAIFCARGGYGSARTLAFVDEIAIKANPKIFLGYSDITSFLLYLYKRCSLVTFHGPMVAIDPDKLVRDKTRASLLSALTLSIGADPASTGPNTLKILKSGFAEGVLLGGCLSILIHSLGTRYEPDFKDKILFLEDIDEAPYRIDRMLTHLKSAGKLQQVNGIVFGEMKRCHPSPEDGYPLEEVLLDVLRDLDIPVLFGFPSGHASGEDNLTLPIGVRVQVDGDQGRLFILEAGVS